MRQASRSKRRPRRSLSTGALLALVAACAATKPHPPPEGEWLEWQPKDREAAGEAMGAGDAAKAQKTNDAEEDLDAPARKPKNVAPTVKCKGADLTRESLCVALSDLGGKQCPAKLPNRPENAEAGVFEKPPKGAKREPSLEESGSQCCYAWCGRIPSASPPVPCQNPEPLFCFDAPISTAHAAPPPYGECPMGLKAYKGKGRRKSSPKGAFSSARTKSRRKSAPNACCYQTCT